MKRWNHHLSDLRKGIHHSGRLQNHYNKYGESDLIFSVLFRCEKNKLLNVEQFCLDAYKPYFNIYETVRNYSTKNQSEESNQKRSKAMKGKRHSEEAKRKMSKSMSGLKKSEEHKRKLSIAFKGKKKSPRSEEYRKHISEAKMGTKNPMFGKIPWNKKIV